MQGRQYDAIVVGARCAGAPTAMLLARKGHRVLLVDRATFPRDTLSTHVIHPPGVAALARWDLTVVRAFTEGAELPVLEVRGRSWGPAVLKLGGHGSDHAQQVRVLRAADGRGYVRVLDHSEEHEATLLERLGVPLHATVRRAEDEVDVLAGLLPMTWALPLPV